MNTGAWLLRCICDETRFEMLVMLLGRGELCVGDFVDAMGRDQPLVSHHLRRLRECGIVSSRQDGKKTIYMIANPMLAELVSDIASVAGRMPNLCGMSDDGELRDGKSYDDNDKDGCCSTC